jgi:hypothetical protein
LENNAFTGTLPNELGNAVELTELKLHVNQMTGTIPSSIGGMSDLGKFLLSDWVATIMLLRLLIYIFRILQLH